MTSPREEGAALLTVLLLVAAMAALAVGVLDDIRFGIRRQANAETVGQAQWYAIGAETLARQRLPILSRGVGNSGSEREWNGRWLTFPIDNGVIRTRLTDAALCFNLNSVVQGAAEQWSRRELGLTQFAALLKELGIAGREAEALTESLGDWIDTDGTRNTLGAEDDAYANVGRPYRTSGALLSEVSELRAIRGFTPEIYARIRPFVCALPMADLSPININLIDADRAVLLGMLLNGEVEIDALRRLIASRPANGWQSVDDFWNDPALREHLPADSVLNQVSVRSRFFNLEAQAEYAGGEAVLTSLFEQAPTGASKLLARRWTIDE